jgi:SAM-dependent methyltransferase
LTEKIDWRRQAQKGFLASGIDPADRRGRKNYYIDLLHKMALEETLELKGDEFVLDFGCGSGRMAYWIAPRVRKVVGLESTPEMIQLAEKNRKADSVEFILYDGVHLPVFSHSFDLVLSIWVLQHMGSDLLKKKVSELPQYLKNGGKFYLIEQASDNPKVGRPSIKEYLNAFNESKLECLRHYPIRKGRWWLLYLIRYGMIPRVLFPKIAKHEIRRLRNRKRPISYYQDYLFALTKT